MNIALIFAGGTGQRMNTCVRPKQFLELHGKPIIVYTAEHFQNHPLIDGIVIVCLEGWISYCGKLIRQYGITKASAIVPGGENGQASIYNGLKEISKRYPPDSVILIHDGVRPLITEQLITQNIECVKERGTAITVSPAIETVAFNTDGNKIGRIIDRKKCQMAKAPQCFILSEILSAHQKAVSDKKLDFIDSASLMLNYGHPLYCIEGPMENIKITTPSDYYIFRALMDAKENSQIFGL